MKIASVAEIKAHLSAYLKHSEQGPVVVTRNGRPVAVIVGVSDEDELERLILAHTPRFREIIAAGRNQIRAGEGIGHAEFWAGIENGKTRGKKVPARRKKRSA